MSAVRVPGPAPPGVLAAPAARRCASRSVPVRRVASPACAGGSGAALTPRSKAQKGPLGRRRVRGYVAVTAKAPTEEDTAWKKREEEAQAAGIALNGSEWKWTLNWHEVVPDILVGSCPRSPEDVGTLASEGQVGAILSLQSDDCLQALSVDMAAIKAAATEAGVLHTRVAVRDFDRDDQAAMLPEVVRVLAALVGTGRRVYVHCTAGINRAPLAVIGYLAFCKGWQVNDAVAAVKKPRAVANPYLESLYTAKARMLHGRNDELTFLSRQLYEQRQAKGQGDNGRNDWYDAEEKLIRRMFQRRAAADGELMQSLERVLAKRGASLGGGPSEGERLLSSALAASRQGAAEAAEAAAAQAARAQSQAEQALAAEKQAGADALATQRNTAAAELARAHRQASDAALEAAAALDGANAAAQAALSAAAEQAARELDAAAAEAQQAAEVAARTVRAALDAADVQAKASSARQAVLEAEVRRLADSAAGALRFDAESHKAKSDLEMAALELMKTSATEVQRQRGAAEELRRELTDLKLQLAQQHTQLVLLQGVAPQQAAAAALAAVAAGRREGHATHAA